MMLYCMICPKSLANDHLLLNTAAIENVYAQPLRFDPGIFLSELGVIAESPGRCSTEKGHPVAWES